MAKILVLEDEVSIRRAIVEILKSLDKSLDIYEADTASKALLIASEENIDIFMVDIVLNLQAKNDISGLKFATAIRENVRYRKTPLIFLTSVLGYQDAALHHIHCYDYLAKPINRAQLEKIVKGLLQASELEETNEHMVFFQARGIFYPMKENDICFIEHNARIVDIHTVTGVTIIKGMTLKACMEVLNNKQFVQCHQSYIVRLDCVKAFDERKKKVWVRDGSGECEIDCGVRYIQNFKKELMRYANSGN